MNTELTPELIIPGFMLSTDTISALTILCALFLVMTIFILFKKLKQLAGLYRVAMQIPSKGARESAFRLTGLSVFSSLIKNKKVDTLTIDHLNQLKFNKNTSITKKDLKNIIYKLIVITAVSGKL